ncbi:putative disease resistance protein At1g50180 [Olea europaea var. sylvestris]|uniref:Disease resistance At1g50180 n=1 Tax=Olea europaea subsp. europaea TaxID=158383 RepID=A0A8S0UX72_OLEEU|nr:putative disease resistance protein At1g50180 [Olea europaea var. sylvestris]CAA3025379.1 disease resistance At1g50180 [Olea europaea subsp. europaea]
MAEPVVSITLETIRDLLVEEVKLYSGVKSQVEQIQQQLQLMRSFLKDADANQDADERLRNWVAEVREAAYDIEDNILLFVAAKIAARRYGNSRNLFKKMGCFFREIITTFKVGHEISDIKNKIINLTTSLHTFGIKPINNHGENPGSGDARIRDLTRSYSHVVEEDFVGLQGDVKMLVTHLIDEQKDRVISIYGMGGLGKTTIARKVYSNRDVRRHFDGFAWTCVSRQWDKKDILQGILIKLIPEKRDEILDMRDEELVKALHDVQLKKKCLVVLDDIWSIQAWDSLKPAFPNTRNGAGSKILLTTRNGEVASHVYPSGFRYEPRCLSSEESWELLRKKAFPRRQDIPEYAIEPEMETLGKEMVARCCGLPLAILVLGGLLVRKHSVRDWQTVYENINWYLTRGRGHGQQQAVNDVLAFSYHDLPYQFKQCFLFLANFPEDFEIEAEKLYQFWLAEGIISQEERAEEETMMDVAERYLAELAQRCMVQVNVKETAGGFKNCRLHDLMRDLCLSKAKDENFTKVVDFRRDKKPMDSLSLNCRLRRISIYLDSNVTQDAVTCSENSHIRSAFFYANDCREDVLQQMKFHLSSLKLLRVLYLQGFQSADELPKSIGGLIHLKHLSLSYSQFKKLPSSLSKLVYLQTLDLEVDNSLQIPNIIYRMERLRHLYLPKSFHTEDGSKLRLDGLSELETLVNFNTSLCDVKDLDTLTNLRKLRASIKDKLDDLPNILKYISFTKNHLRRSSLSISCPQFCSDAELSLLRTLLGCHRLYKLSIEGRIGKLPEFYHFSSSIAKIAFKASSLEEDPMATLEKLPKLSSLTLYSSTFVGEEMACTVKGFPKLLYLKLWGLSNLKRWRIDAGAMPKLSRLVIARCENLEMLPDGLKFITTLQKLNIRWMSDDFKDRLRAVDGDEGDDLYKVRHVPDIKLD